MYSIYQSPAFHFNLQDLLLSSDIDDPGKVPIIFLSDVSYTELECLIQYIYTGRAKVQEGPIFTNFTRLAKTMGVTGIPGFNITSYNMIGGIISLCISIQHSIIKYIMYASIVQGLPMGALELQTRIVSEDLVEIL